MRRLTAALAALVIVAAATPAMAASQSEFAETRAGTAAYHSVANAEAAGYGSTLDALGCFESDSGGMGVHYLNGSLLDGSVNAATPEALVYEMRDNGGLKLVGVEYLVPAELVDPTDPPELFGRHFHPHPVLPLWIMHAWTWRPNPSGMFADFNPAVAMCPDGVPVFGD